MSVEWQAMPAPSDLCPCASGKKFSECHGLDTVAETPAAKEAPRSQPGPYSDKSRPRGFAAMDRKLVSEIARKGGKAAHRAGTAHEFTSEEARRAGRVGGRVSHEKRRARGEE